MLKNSNQQETPLQVCLQPVFLILHHQYEAFYQESVETKKAKARRWSQTGQREDQANTVQPNKVRLIHDTAVPGRSQRKLNPCMLTQPLIPLFWFTRQCNTIPHCKKCVNQDSDARAESDATHSGSWHHQSSSSELMRLRRKNERKKRAEKKNCIYSEIMSLLLLVWNHKI